MTEHKAQHQAHQSEAPVVSNDHEPKQGRTVGVAAEDVCLAARRAFMEHVMRCYQCSHVGVNCAQADGLEARMNTAREAAHAEPAGQS
jgi:hypothetical protein